MKVIQIAIDQIEQTENSRVNYKTQDLAQLMESMKEDGQLQPIGVMKSKKGYEAVFGNRRLIAAKKLGWKTISASVLEVDSENDRDILNLVENMKRKNTTLSEDGRIFSILESRGLTKAEIGARLGISLSRVETALWAFQRVPEEFRADIKNSRTGPRQEGSIAASSAHAIMGIQNRFNLKEKDTKELLECARKKSMTPARIMSIAPAIAAGSTVHEAITAVESLKTVEIRVFVKPSDIEKLEKNSGKTIKELLLEHLRKFPGAEVLQYPSASNFSAIRNSSKVLKKAKEATQETQ